MRLGMNSATAITMYAVATVIGCTLMGNVLFGEKLSTLNVLGIVIGILSLILVAVKTRPTTDIKTDVMTFDQFKEFVKSIPVPAQRVGIFNLCITYRKNTYSFYSLKQDVSYDGDLMGFGLHHHFGNIRELPTARSIFHDSEDVSIEIWRNEVKAIEKKAANEIHIKTTKWEGTLTWQ